MDEVEWEIVRADIAMEKARLEANGDWAKWRESQTRTNLRRAALVAPADWAARAVARSGLDGAQARLALGSEGRPLKPSRKPCGRFARGRSEGTAPARRLPHTRASVDV